MGKMGSRSSSGALQDMFRDYDDKLGEAVRSISSPEGCNGVAFAIHAMGGAIFPLALGLREWKKNRATSSASR